MILKTKLNLPQPKAGVLLRTGLIELIKNNLDKKLILICGGAGYGKTTLLGQLVKSQKLQHVYYSLDQGDSDLTAFYSYLIADLEKLSPGLAARSAELLAQSNQIGNNYELLMGTLINEFVAKRKDELFIILDDYQFLSETSNVHQALDYFINYLPEIVHVIIASRSQAQFYSLAKWIAKQDAFVVSRSDLCFSAGEVSELLAKAYSQKLGDADLNALLDHTEGWITGIQLILANIQGAKPGKTVAEALSGYLATDHAGAGGKAAPADSADRRASDAEQELFDYFADEIYAGETDAVRAFLESSSVLIDITAEACNYMMGIGNAGAIIDDLARRNLFVGKVSPGVFKYHRLFREFLRARLQRNPEKPELCRKAAEYCLKQGWPKQAVDMYLESGDFKNAAHIAAGIIEGMILAGRINVVTGWLDQFPDQIVQASPSLLYGKGLICEDQHMFPQAREYFLAAERIIGRMKRSRKTRPEYDAVLPGSLLKRAEISWKSGEFEEALRINRAALKCCPARPQRLRACIMVNMGLMLQSLGNCRAAGRSILGARALLNDDPWSDARISVEASLANLYIRTGQSRKAWEIFKETTGRMDGHYFYNAGVFYANAAFAALTVGETGWARQCLERGLATCGPYEDSHSQIAIQNAYGVYCLQVSDWEQAECRLQRALAECERKNWQSAREMALQNFIRMYRYRRMFPEAAACFARLSWKTETVENITSIGNLAEQAMIGAYQGNFDQALRDIAKCARLVKKYRWRNLEFQIKLARCLILLQLDRKCDAARLARQLLELAEKEGYDGLLGREMANDARLSAAVQRCAGSAGRKNSARQGYLDRILKSARLVTREPAGSAVVSVRMFGTLEIASAGGQKIRLAWRSRKIASLFAYLLIHRNRVCEHEELVEAFWPSTALRQAKKDIYTMAFWLKTVLKNGFPAAGSWGRTQPEFIVHQDQGYRIDPGIDFRLDIEEFKRLLQTARAAEREGRPEESLDAYGKCLELYRDDFLINLGERWCEEQREEYRSLFLGCLKNTIRLLADQGKHDQAAACCRRYISREPYEEEIRELYWTELKASGKQDEIKNDYQLLKKLLWRKFREKIRPETENTCRKLLSQL